MSNLNIKFNNKSYSIPSDSLAPATAALEAHLRSMADAPGNERLEGDGQEFHTMAPSSLSFRSTAPLDELVDVKINGEVVDPSNYTLTEGSTIVTFPIDYLQGLLQGKHEVTVESQNGSASGDFTVVNPEKNEHGFYYNMPYHVVADNVGFFIVIFKEDGSIVYRDILFAQNKNGSYAVENNNLVGTLDGSPVTFEIREDSLYTENVHSETALTFTLNSQYSAADADYLYFFDTEDECYHVCALNTEITSLDTMKSSIHDYPVTTLAWRALDGCLALTNVVIPNNITRLDEAAFNDCTQLRSVVIPDSVKVIGWSAFNGCTSLTDVEIGKGVTHMGRVAFNECGNLKNVIFKGTAEQWQNINFAESAANSFHKTSATWVRCTDGRVSVLNGEVDYTTPVKNEHGFYYDVPYTFSMPVEDDGVLFTAMTHVVLKESGVVEAYSSVPEMGLNGQPQDIGVPYIYNNGTIIIPGDGEDMPEISIAVSGDGLSLIDTQGLLLGTPGAAFVCTFEDYHDIYFGATYYVHPALVGTDFQDMILNADGSATDIYGNIVAPVGAITYASHIITMGELSGFVSMDGTTLFADGQPIWSTFDHICKFVNQSPNSEYLASEATCQSPAKYYYSCSCGKVGTETFEYGEPNPDNHTYEDGFCADCGKKQPGLYKTGTNYTELLMSWDELVANNIVNQYGSVNVEKIDLFAGDLLCEDTAPVGFVGCSNLTGIRFSNRTTGIGYMAISSCTSLTSVVIPDSVTSIGYAAFQDCSSLTNIIFNGTIAQWGAITKDTSWNSGVPATHVHCSDGDVAL